MIFHYVEVWFVLTNYLMLEKIQLNMLVSRLTESILNTLVCLFVCLFT